MRPALQEMGKLPPTISVPQAAKILGLGKDRVYRAARSFLEGGDGIPCIRLVEGSSIRVLSGPLIKLLGIEPTGAPEVRDPAAGEVKWSK